MFRWPKQNISFNNKFYQLSYSKHQQSVVTEFPPDLLLEKMKKTNFSEIQRNYDNYSKLIGFLNPKTILDYGCSWGYGVYQFQKYGFQTVGLEVSKPRAEFGRSKLGVSIYDDPEEIIEKRLTFDIIFTSHVLEHLPTPSIAWQFFKTVSHSKTILVMEVPNCGGYSASKLGLKWGPFSSSLHPLSYTSNYFINSLGPNYQRVHFFSNPFLPKEEFDNFMKNPCLKSPLGDDLIVIAGNI
jgi:2-polyprenyl-3-methyl-5-hydroxy-6-metoxy-1,4-benzoquinol methylase